MSADDTPTSLVTFAIRGRGFFRETHVSEVQPELAARLLDVARAIDNVLVSPVTRNATGCNLRHPPFPTGRDGRPGFDGCDRRAGGRRGADYGGPGAGAGPVDHVQVAVDALSVAWTGKRDDVSTSPSSMAMHAMCC